MMKNKKLIITLAIALCVTALALVLIIISGGIRHNRFCSGIRSAVAFLYISFGKTAAFYIDIASAAGTIG